MANPFLDKSKDKPLKTPSLIAIEVPAIPPATKEQMDALFGKDRKQIILGNPPSKSNCYRIVTFKSKDHPDRTYSTLAKTKQLKQYEEWFKLQCNLYRNLGIQIDFKFEMDVYYPSRRADLDNSLKCTLDCLQMVGAIKNDNLCQEIIVRRHIDAKNPRVEFVITPITA